MIINSRSFYGYHSENSTFLKILFYQPYSVKIAVDLLQVNNNIPDLIVYLLIINT